MLTLLTLDTRTQQCKQRTFTIVDLAGAERPEKALGERISKDKAIQEMFRYLKTPSADSARGPAQKLSRAYPCPGPFWTRSGPFWGRSTKRKKKKTKRCRLPEKS